MASSLEFLRYRALIAKLHSDCTSSATQSTRRAVSAAFPTPHFARPGVLLACALHGPARELTIRKFTRKSQSCRLSLCLSVDTYTFFTRVEMTVPILHKSWCADQTGRHAKTSSQLQGSDTIVYRKSCRIAPVKTVHNAIAELPEPHDTSQRHVMRKTRKPEKFKSLEKQ